MKTQYNSHEKDFYSSRCTANDFFPQTTYFLQNVQRIKHDGKLLALTPILSLEFLFASSLTTLFSAVNRALKNYRHTKTRHNRTRWHFNGIEKYFSSPLGLLFYTKNLFEITVTILTNYEGATFFDLSEEFK